MSTNYKHNEKIQGVRITSLLNQLLAGAIDLRLSAKHAHWNVKGEGFFALHELFDAVSAAVDEYADMLAERAVQLGGTAQGSLQTASCQSSLSLYPPNIHAGQEHIKALSAAIGLFAGDIRQATSTAIDADDMVTADILTEISRGLEKFHWLVRSHMSE